MYNTVMLKYAAHGQGFEDLRTLHEMPVTKFSWTDIASYKAGSMFISYIEYDR